MLSTRKPGGPDVVNRKNNFDAVRILAASAVIYGHAHPLTATPDVLFMGNSIQSFAVKVFFVVSGYLVARSWASDANALRYLAKRCLRIFPALFLLLLLTTFVLGPLLTSLPVDEYLSSAGSWLYLLYNAALYPAYGLPGVFATTPYPNAVNGSLWSLPAEFMMYLVFPVIYALGRMLGRQLMLLFFTLLLCASSLYFIRIVPVGDPIIFYGTGMHSVLDVGPYFFLGSVFSLTRLKNTLNAATAVFMAGIALFYQPETALLREIYLYVLTPYCVLSLATASSPILQDAGRWGDPSYGIYLYGWPFQQMALHFIPNLSAIGNTLIALPLAALAAYASWHLIEHRALAAKPRSKLQPLTGTQ